MTVLQVGHAAGDRGNSAENARENDEATPATTDGNPATAGASDNSGQLATDPVEGALANALGEATKAGRWDVVGQLARELEARRTARLGVVDLDRVRRERERR